MESKIINFHNRLINKQITFSEYAEFLRKNIQAMKFTNSFMVNTMDQWDLEKMQNDLPSHTNDLLYGVPYTLKDNFMTKGIVSTAGSRLLQNFKPPYNATVFDLLQQKKCLLVGKTALDEFGMGGTGLLSFHSYVYHAHNGEHITAGSSSGSVNAVSTESCIFSLGTDTGDSVRRPSTFLGVVGFKPSYGLISRYGVAPYSPSLDHVGIITSYVTDTAIVFQHLAKQDSKDYTSIQLPDSNFYTNLKPIKKMTLNVIEDIEQYLSPEVIDHYHEVLDKLKQSGIVINQVKIDSHIVQAIHPTYKLLTFGEAASCYANMTGITFGTNFDLDIHGYHNIITNNRTKGLGTHIQRKFVIGEYVTQGANYEKIFMRCKKFRTLLIQHSEVLFKNADGYLIPGASSVSPLVKDVENDTYKTTFADDLLQLSNFISAPSISLPTGYVNDMPFGINLNTRINEDQKLLNMALGIEEIINFKKRGNNDQ